MEADAERLGRAALFILLEVKFVSAGSRNQSEPINSARRRLF
jgi:hypothetical protein